MKKIYIVSVALIVLMIGVSAGVFASEELVAHDFGDFKMNIPESQVDITDKQGNYNQTIYAVPNTDTTTFAFIEFWDTSNTAGNNNTTAFVLNKVKENNFTAKTEGNITSWETEKAGEHGYLISSDDNTKVLIITSADTRIQQAIDSIEFK